MATVPKMLSGLATPFGQTRCSCAAVPGGRAWAAEERACGGRLLSDRAPVEATIRAGVRRVAEAML